MNIVSLGQQLLGMLCGPAPHNIHTFGLLYDCCSWSSCGELQMLTKKVELLMRAMEVDQRKHGREISALKEELSTLKAELGTRGPRRSTASPRAARS